LAETLRQRGWSLHLEGEPYIELGPGRQVKPGEGGKFRRRDIENLSADDLSNLQRVVSPLREVVGLRDIQAQLPAALDQFQREYQTRLQALRAAGSRGAMDDALENARAFYEEQKSVLPASVRQEFLQAKQQMLQAGYAKARSDSEAAHFRNALLDFFRRHREAKENLPQHWEEEFIQEEHRKEFQGRLDAMQNASTFDELDQARKEIDALVRKHAHDLGPEARGQAAATFDSVWQSCFPPALPARLQATRSNEDGISLSWDKAGGAAQYRVYRGDSASQESRSLLCSVDASAAPAPGLLDAAAEPGKDYFYWITAKNGKAESDYLGPASGKRKEKTGSSAASQPPPDVLSEALRAAHQGDVAGILGIYSDQPAYGETWLGLLEMAWRKVSKDLNAVLDAISLDDLSARQTFHEGLDRKLEQLLQRDPPRIPKISEYRSKNSQLSERIDARKAVLLEQKDLIHMAETVITRGDVTKVEEMVSRLRKMMAADPALNEQLQKLLGNARERVEKEETKNMAPADIPKPVEPPAPKPQTDASRETKPQTPKVQEPEKTLETKRDALLEEKPAPRKWSAKRLALAAVCALMALAAVAAAFQWNTHNSSLTKPKPFAQSGEAVLKEAQSLAAQGDEKGIEKLIRENPNLEPSLRPLRQTAETLREGVLAQAREFAGQADVNAIKDLQTKFPQLAELENLANQAGQKATSVLGEAKSLADLGQEQDISSLAKQYPKLQSPLAREQARARDVAGGNADVVEQARQLAGRALVPDIEKLLQAHPALESSLKPLRQQAETLRDGVLAQARALAAQADAGGIQDLQTKYPRLPGLEDLVNEADKKAGSVLTEAETLAQQGNESDIMALQKQYPKLSQRLASARQKAIDAILALADVLVTRARVSDLEKLIQDNPQLNSELSARKLKAETVQANVLQKATNLAAQADAENIAKLQSDYPSLAELKDLQSNARQNTESICNLASRSASKADVSTVEKLLGQFPVLASRLEPFRQQAIDKQNEVLRTAQQLAAQGDAGDLAKLHADYPAVDLTPANSKVPARPSPPLGAPPSKYTNGVSMAFTYVAPRGEWPGGYVANAEVARSKFAYSRPTPQYAANFCADLTTQEEKSGKLRPGWKYRLPSFREWKALEGASNLNPLTPSLNWSAVLVSGSPATAPYSTVTRAGQPTSKREVEILGPGEAIKVVLVRER
jgi:hypothetical protein